MSEVSADDIAKAAELDETASFVVVSEETRRKLAEIPDVIKSTNCALCKVKFDDVIHLARHKCPRIVHEEYKCSECEKVSQSFTIITSFRFYSNIEIKKSC
uniref:C2H2-type domain-containing protein n=1 Tax=Panagrolaimus sp. PS1159 TaxID=55785 RepID=A0AC35FA95_9BILA